MNKVFTSHPGLSGGETVQQFVQSIRKKQDFKHNEKENQMPSQRIAQPTSKQGSVKRNKLFTPVQLTKDKAAQPNKTVVSDYMIKQSKENDSKLKKPRRSQAMRRSSSRPQALEEVI